MQRVLVSSSTAVRNVGTRSFSLLNKELQATPSSFGNWRTLGPLGPYLRDQPSHVEEGKKLFGDLTNPLYTFQRGKMDGFLNSASYVTCAAGVLLVLTGAPAPPPLPPHPLDSRLPFLPH